MNTKPTPEQIAELPKWAQGMITTMDIKIQDERDLADHLAKVLESVFQDLKGPNARVWNAISAWRDARK